MTGRTGLKFEIENSNAFGPLKLARLVDFENILDFRLPDDYRNFLIEHNGGHPKGATRAGSMHHVCGLHEGPSWAQFRPHDGVLSKLLPSTVLPIADDPFGNLYCLSLVAPNRGAVYFWNHESTGPESFRFRAVDFLGFLEGVAWTIAMMGNDLASVQDAIGRGVDIHLALFGEDRLLDIAMEHSGVHIQRMLLDAGSPLRIDAALTAARRRNPAMLQMVVERGANVNYKTSTGFSPLMETVRAGAIEVVEFLLSRGADPDAVNNWGHSVDTFARTEPMKELLRSAR